MVVAQNLFDMCFLPDVMMPMLSGIVVLDIER